MRALGWLSLLGLLVGLAASFGYAPREAVQGNVQRIMYLHVPAVLTAYLAFALVLVGSVGYLLTRRTGWDRLALAAAEPGVLFTGITIASGSIWGKPTWGTWWTWDARLTSTAVLFLVYVGYLLRSEEHTSELQSHHDLVCRLLLEKKKKLAKPDIDYHTRHPNLIDFD